MRSNRYLLPAKAGTWSLFCCHPLASEGWWVKFESTIRLSWYPATSGSSETDVKYSPNLRFKVWRLTEIFQVVRWGLNSLELFILKGFPIFVAAVAFTFIGKMRQNLEPFFNAMGYFFRDVRPYVCPLAFSKCRWYLIFSLSRKSIDFF